MTQHSQQEGTSGARGGTGGDIRNKRGGRSLETEGQGGFPNTEMPVTWTCFPGGRGVEVGINQGGNESDLQRLLSFNI